jgi:hypothetical protein
MTEYSERGTCICAEYLEGPVYVINVLAENSNIKACYLKLRLFFTKVKS